MDKIQTIATKTLDNGELIYLCVPKRGVKIMPLGYFKTKEEAVEAFLKEINGKE